MNGNSTKIIPDKTALGIDSTELVRLIVQALDDIGCSDSARSLEQESGIYALSPSIRKLRQTILDGNWDEVKLLLSNKELFYSKDAVVRAAFYIYRQKFLELLEAGQTKEALQCLRTELSPCNIYPEKVHELTMLVMYSDPYLIRQKANWSGACVETRLDVLNSLHSCMPPSLLLPENRLQALLNTVIEDQKSKSFYPYTRQEKASLLEDLDFDPDKLPSHTICTLSYHSDEVWFVQFSKCGKYLASASKDKTTLVYMVEKFSSSNTDDAIYQRLVGHDGNVSYLSWSPCSNKLLTCGSDKDDGVVKLWNIHDGLCIGNFVKHQKNISACCWFPSGDIFATASMDQTINIWDYKTEEVIHTYNLGLAVTDLSISADGRYFVAIDSEKKIRIFDNNQKAEIFAIKETQSVISLATCAEGKRLIANISSQTIPEIKMYSIPDGKLLKKYRGHCQSRFVIRSCFGGYKEMFIVSGSEDGNVYMWHRDSGNLLETLKGHTSTVNSVSWNPKDIALFASASDDHTVRIWGPQSRVR